MWSIFGLMSSQHKLQSLGETQKPAPSLVTQKGKPISSSLRVREKNLGFLDKHRKDALLTL